MAWERKPPTEPGWYWYRTGKYAGYRVTHLGYPGKVQELHDCNARAGEPMTPKDMLSEEYPHGQFHFPGLSIPGMDS